MAAAAPSTPRRSSNEYWVGNWRRLEPIGKGSFAVVYKAVHPTDKSLVAIKTVQHSQLKGKLKANLFSEIDILRSIQHPHIVALINILESTNHIHLVMEFCQLGDLAAFVKKRDKLADHAVCHEMLRKYPNPPGAGFNEVIVRHFTKQLSSALEFLRSKNLVHRDVKPQNLLLNPPPAWIAKERPENRPYEVAKNALIPMTGIESLPSLKLADFGFARQLENKGMAETLCGSPLYMAPEILRYEKYDAKADLWSVGAVLYELMVGRPPFRAANHVDLLRKIEQTNDRIRFPEEVIVSEDMKRVIRSLLKKMPTERMSWENFFQSAVIVDEIPGLAESDKPQSKLKDVKAVPEKVETARRSSSEASSSQDRPQPQLVSRRLSTARPPSGTPPVPSPLSNRVDAEPTQPVRPVLSHNVTAPTPQGVRRGSVTANPLVERRRSSFVPAPGTSAPTSQTERDRISQRASDRQSQDAREKADQDIRFERDYVIVEKRAVQVNALADEIGARAPAGAAMMRRATTQGIPASLPNPGISSRQGQSTPRSEASHARKESYERRYGPSKTSATSALANALNMVQFRLYNGPLGTAFGKGQSPPQGYGPFPAFQSQPSGPLIINESNKTGSLDDDHRMLTNIEESATRSDVVFGFAEVKYKQLIPIGPSNDNPLGIRRPGSGEEDDDDLTPDAIVNISEEALVLYVKTLAILTNCFNLAGTWWNEKGRTEHDSKSADKSSVPVRINHVVQWVRNRFNECLEKSEYVGRRLADAQRRLPRHHPSHPSNRSPEESRQEQSAREGNLVLTSGVTAEKLMYDRAIEMSRHAGVNELVGEDLAGCEISYRTAKRLLEAVLENDDDLKPKHIRTTAPQGDAAEYNTIDGIEDADREKIIQVLEGVNGRLVRLRGKMDAYNAARRASKTSGASPPTTGAPPSTSPKPSSPRLASVTAARPGASPR